MNDINKKEINDVLIIVNQILPLVDVAESKFRSARNWGYFDILGGGFIVDMIKHSQLHTAAIAMNKINILLYDLQRELKDISFPTDYSMNTASLATFADFFFDGVLADVYMQTKIISSLDLVRELRNRLLALRDRLSKFA